MERRGLGPKNLTQGHWWRESQWTPPTFTTRAGEGDRRRRDPHRRGSRGSGRRETWTADDTPQPCRRTRHESRLGLHFGVRRHYEYQRTPGGTYRTRPRSQEQGPDYPWTEEMSGTTERFKVSTDNRYSVRMTGARRSVLGTHSGRATHAARAEAPE